MSDGFNDYFGYIVNLASKLQAKAKPSGGIVIDKEFLESNDFKDFNNEIRKCNLTISLLGKEPVECWATKEVREDLPWKCIAWPGYGPYSHDGGVHVLTHEGIQGPLWTLALWERGVDDDKAWERYFDIIIDDLDTLVRWHKTKQIKLFECEAQDCKQDLEELLNPISPGIKLYTLEHGFALVPIRCGVNAIAFNRDTYAEKSLKKNLSSYKVLLKYLCKNGKTPGGLKLGLWDHAYSSLALLLVALGFRSELGMVHEAQSQDFEKLVTTNFIETENKPFKVYSDISKMAENLHQGRNIDVVLGGGSWLMSSKRTKIDSFVPKEGALLWVEAAGVLRSNRGNDWTKPMGWVKNLITPEAQEKLRETYPYTSCPVVDAVVKKLRYKHDNNDASKIFKRDGTLKKGIIARPSPDGIKLWESTWQEFKTKFCED